MGKLAKRPLHAGAEIHDHLVITGGQQGQIVAENLQASRRYIGEAAGTGSSGDNVKVPLIVVNHRLIEGQAAGNDAAEVMLGHQAELDIKVGQAQIAVKQQDADVFAGQRVGQGNGEPSLADAPLSGSNGEYVASLGAGGEIGGYQGI